MDKSFQELKTGYAKQRRIDKLLNKIVNSYDYELIQRKLDQVTYENDSDLAYKLDELYNSLDIEYKNYLN